MKRNSDTPSEDDPISDPNTRWTQVTQRYYDPEGDEELVTALVFAIAAAREVDPTEVKSPPLVECVDVAALEDALFGSEVAGDSGRGAGTVEFRYGPNLVTVESAGWIQVYSTTDGGQP